MSRTLCRPGGRRQKSAVRPSRCGHPLARPFTPHSEALGRPALSSRAVRHGLQSQTAGPSLPRTPHTEEGEARLSPVVGRPPRPESLWAPAGPSPFPRTPKARGPPSRSSWAVLHSPNPGPPGRGRSPPVHRPRARWAASYRRGGRAGISFVFHDPLNFLFVSGSTRGPPTPYIGRVMGGVMRTRSGPTVSRSPCLEKRSATCQNALGRHRGRDPRRWHGTDSLLPGLHLVTDFVQTSAILPGRLPRPRIPDGRPVPYFPGLRTPRKERPVCLLWSAVRHSPSRCVHRSPVTCPRTPKRIRPGRRCEHPFWGLPFPGTSRSEIVPQLDARGLLGPGDAIPGGGTAPIASSSDFVLHPHSEHGDRPTARTPRPCATARVLATIAWRLWPAVSRGPSPCLRRGTSWQGTSSDRRHHLPPI